MTFWYHCSGVHGKWKVPWRKWLRCFSQNTWWRQQCLHGLWKGKLWNFSNKAAFQNQIQWTYLTLVLFAKYFQTVFYFDVKREHFRESLDRLAQFFIHPLMKQGSVDREIKAVDSGNVIFQMFVGQEGTTSNWLIRTNVLLRTCSGLCHRGEKKISFFFQHDFSTKQLTLVYFAVQNLIWLWRMINIGRNNCWEV